MHGLVRGNINAGAWKGCVIQRCQNKNPRQELRPGYLGDVTHWKQGLRFEKKQVVEFPPRKKKVDFQSWARPDNCTLRAPRVDWIES